VRQIVHISSIYDIEEVEKRLNEFSDCHNYSLNVIYGPPPIPYVDVMTISNYWACVDFSTDAVQPFRASVGLEFYNPALVDTLTKYFNIWWSRFSTPIKIKNQVNHETIERLRAILHDSQSWLAGRRLSEFCLIAQKDQAVRNFIDAAIHTAGHTHAPAAIETYGPTFAAILSEATSKLPLIVNEGKTVECAFVETVLINMVSYAGKATSVQAVSYDPEQQSFWKSPFGEKFLAANAEAVRRGVKVRRIFILSKHQLDDSRNICALLRKQVDAGVLAYYITEQKVSQDMRRDFIIQGGQITFEMEVSKDSAPVKQGILHISPEYALKRSATFEALLKMAEQFSTNQKTL
jgi:hypothetical protein